MSNHFFFGAEMKIIVKKIGTLTCLFTFFLMPLVMVGCTRKDFLCITFVCPFPHYQAYLRLTRLKMSEIILTGCKTQIIIIKTMAAQLKVHINTTTVTKYDNNKYGKPEQL